MSQIQIQGCHKYNPKKIRHWSQSQCWGGLHTVYNKTVKEKKSVSDLVKTQGQTEATKENDEMQGCERMEDAG